MTEQELRNITGTIFNIQHYCIHDGPGIRTNVFVKGCPLRCIWCANPESQLAHPQLMYRADKCVGCGACAAVCPQKAVSIGPDGKAHTDRALCNGCGACIKACRQEARERMGYTATVGQVFDEVSDDALFYADEGGVTVTGGEALAHPKFTKALLTLCRNAGIGTAVETCGFVPWETMKPVLELCDTVLFDNKQMDSEKHRQYTGQPNDLILSNLEKINDELTCDIWVRVPTIPGYNADEENIRRLAEYVSTRITRCKRIDLLPFHKLGEAKHDQLELEANGFSSTVPDAAFMENLRAIVRSYGLECK